MKTPILNLCHLVGVALPKHKNYVKVRHLQDIANNTSTLAKEIMNKYYEVIFLRRGKNKNKVRILTKSVKVFHIKNTLGVLDPHAWQVRSVNLQCILPKVFWRITGVSGVNVVSMSSLGFGLYTSKQGVDWSFAKTRHVELQTFTDVRHGIFCGSYGPAG